MYKLSKKAEEDFGAIYDYTWLNFGEDQADDYTDDMERCLLILSEARLCLAAITVSSNRE